MQIILFLLVLAGFGLCSEVKILSDNFYPAGLNIIKIETKNAYIEVKTDHKTIKFPVYDGISFFAIPYRTGKIAVLNVISEGRVIFRKFIKIKKRKYPVSKITVKERKLTNELIERIKNENRILRKKLSEYTEKKFTESSFIKPLKALSISTPFGAKRIINGKKRSVHWGVDFKAPEGTEVYASLSGRVVLARELFYTGKTVVIDHGLGLHTLYAHLSSIAVKEGQMIKGGQIIGKVGSTGRSTGPHLHFGIYLGGVRVDPYLAFRLKL
ncbi:MAG TPA: M23 family metallopeptidase [Persephonella sp.]|nr:M23 family metallopeptidase [Persephonella sp.]